MCSFSQPWIKNIFQPKIPESSKKQNFYHSLTTLCSDPHKGFHVVSKAERDAFLELSCFFYEPVGVGNLIFGSSAVSKFGLNIWKFSVHKLLKPHLQDFEHYFASV